MRHFHFTAALTAAIAVSAMAVPLMAQTADAQPTTVSAVPLPNWLAGCWIAGGAEGAGTEECWTVPRGSMVLGSGHNFVGPRTRSFEHMRIESVEGSLVFVAHPGGSSPTRFALQATEGGNGLLFVNAENDYPQRVHYWREGAELVAEISQIDGSNAMRWRFRRS